MTVEELRSPAELEEVVELQSAVWGMPPAETVPVHLLGAARHAGGLVAGVRQEGELVGFVFGLAASLEGRLGHHSHMLGVRPSHRGRGLGESLKWYQRRWCLERGIDLVRWTFDPLQAGNAYLNLDKLGALAIRYLEDAYGPLRGPLHGGIPSDRLLVEWHLDHQGVQDRAAGRPPPQLDPGPLVTPLEGDHPSGEVLDLDHPSLAVAIPSSLGELVAGDPEAAHAWRLTARRALRTYLERGYRAEAFSARPVPCLVLRRARPPAPRPQATGAGTGPPP